VTSPRLFPQHENPPAAKTAARPPVRSPGRAATNQHRCAICQVLHPSYAAAERHADQTGHARIELEL